MESLREVFSWMIFGIESFLKESLLVNFIGVLFLGLSFFVKWENVKNLINRFIHDNAFTQLNKNELLKSSRHAKLTIDISDFVVTKNSDELYEYLVNIYHFIELLNIKSKSCTIKFIEYDDYMRIYPQLFRFFDYYSKRNGIKFIFMFRKNEPDLIFIGKIKQALSDLCINNNCIKIV